MNNGAETVRDAVSNLKFRIAARSSEELYAVAKTLGSDIADREINLVRGFVLTEIENRDGGDAVDALMDEMGL